MARKSLSVALAEARAPYAQKIAALESERSELLSVLRALVVWEDPDHKDHEAMAEEWHDRLVGMGETPTSRGVRERLMEAARAAIAKAEGRPT